MTKFLVIMYFKQKNQMKTLTKAEEQVMQALWKIEKGFLKDVIDVMPAPKPHSNTVATLLKILIEKSFVQTTIYGRMNEYKKYIKHNGESLFRRLLQQSSFFFDR